MGKLAVKKARKGKAAAGGEQPEEAAPETQAQEAAPAAPPPKAEAAPVEKPAEEEKAAEKPPEGAAKPVEKPRQPVVPRPVILHDPDRPRYFTVPKPTGDIFDRLATGLWDLGATPDAIVRYRVGKEEWRNGVGGIVTFAFSRNHEMGKELVRELFRPPAPVEGKKPTKRSEVITPEPRKFGEMNFRVGQLGDAPEAVRALALRAPLYVLDEYFFEYDSRVHAERFRAYVEDLCHARFAPAQITGSDERRLPNRSQERAEEKGWLKHPDWVWCQTLEVEKDVFRATGWVVMGYADLEYPDRPYEKGALLVFPPYLVDVGRGPELMSIIQILFLLVVKSGWLLDDVTELYKKLRPSFFTEAALKGRVPKAAGREDSEDLRDREWGKRRPRQGEKVEDRRPRGGGGLATVGEQVVAKAKEQKRRGGRRRGKQDAEGEGAANDAAE